MHRCLRSRRFNTIRYDSGVVWRCGGAVTVWRGGGGGDGQVLAEGETTAMSMARRANSDSDGGGQAAVWCYSGGGGPVLDQCAPKQSPSLIGNEPPTVYMMRPYI